MAHAALGRSERNTPASFNERIRQRTQDSIAENAARGAVAIDVRLHQLEQEWDTERALETLASCFVLGGLALGIGVNRKWLALSGVVGGFLLMHALQGWCPPLPVIRALGFRTRAEIDRERYALKAARGDFEELAFQLPSDPVDAEWLLATMER